MATRPIPVLGTVKLRVVGDPAPMPTRPKNTELRPREYLTPAEVLTLAEAAKNRGRNGHRDSVAIKIAARHGLRVSELCSLTWDQVQGDRLHVHRMKRGEDSVHFLTGNELRELKKLRRETNGDHRHVFITELGTPMTAKGFARMLDRAAADTAIGFKVHPHMLRHACGYFFANEGKSTRELQLWLGHKNITHTARYSALNANVFKDW